MLTNCRGCGTSMQESDKHCPACGLLAAGVIRRRMLWLAAAGAGVLVIAGAVGSREQPTIIPPAASSVAQVSPPAPAADPEAEARLRENRMALAKSDADDFLAEAKRGPGTLSSVLAAAPNERKPATLRVAVGAGLWDRLSPRGRRSLVTQAQQLWARSHCSRGSTASCRVEMLAYDGATAIPVARTSTWTSEVELTDQ